MNNYLGIDVGGSKIKTGVVNDSGELIFRSAIDIPSDVFAFKQAIIGCYNALKNEYNINGVGISSCGGINPYSGEVTPCIAPSLEYLIGENYYSILSEIDVPVALEKDGNCAALGEMWNGNATDLSSYCVLVLGSGLGGGVVYKNQIFEGAHFLAGDAGYAFPSYDTDKSFSALLAPVQVEEQYKSESGRFINIAQMYECRESDEIAKKYYDQFINGLANTVLMMQYIIDPQAFLIGGGITAWDILIPELETAVKKLMNSRFCGPVKPKIRRCKHQNDANIIGAVYNLKMRNKI